jgi:predicted nucleotide-binding protein
MDERKSAIEKLEYFKTLLNEWEYGNPTTQTRSNINKNIPYITGLLRSAGTSKSVTISPPPMVGGLIMKNLNPFDCIFDAPYGLSVVPCIIDSIDATIGIIETNDSFFDNTQSPIKKDDKKNNVKSNRIFIVHGRNNELKETTARFLEKLGLTPIILHEQLNHGKTIIEKFEDYSDVGFAIVLMTPDDMGYFTEENTPKCRARQNVVFELGYFIGKLGRTNVAAIIKGDIEIPTDISGVLYIGVDNSDAWKMMLAKEIKGAGYSIDLNKLF